MIYNTILMNPEFGSLGPRLSPKSELEIFSPDYLNEKAPGRHLAAGQPAGQRRAGDAGHPAARRDGGRVGGGDDAR